MRLFIYVSIACASLLISQAQAGKILDKGGMMEEEIRSAERCHQPYIPDKYVRVGEDQKRDIAFLRKVGKDPLSQRVALLLPNLAKAVRLLLRK